MRSIASRLLVGNAIVLAGFVVLTALAVSWSVHRRAETARLERLQGLVYGILGATEITPDARLVVADGALPERTLAQPVAGLYAELIGNNGERLWQSRSSVRHVPDVEPTPIGEWVFERLEATPGLPAVDRLQLQSVWELDGGEELPFVVHVVDESGSLGAELARFDATLWATLAGAALLLLAVQTLVLRRGLAPLVRIGDEVRAIERGTRETLDGDVPSELAPLAGGLNALLASERGRQRRYRDLLDDLAHSLKTPLTILGNLSARAGVSAASPADASDAGTDTTAGRDGIDERDSGDAGPPADHVSPDELATVREQTALMRASIERSLERATRRSVSVLAPPLAARPVLERLARALVRLHEPRDVRFDIDVDAAFSVRVADADLHEILGNVLENACKYGASRIHVHGGSTQGALLVDDDGPGFPDARERLTQRGVRADAHRAGQGLGLAASRELMESHGGSLALDASPAGGARVILRFASALEAVR